MLFKIRKSKYAWSSYDGLLKRLRHATQIPKLRFSNLKKFDMLGLDRTHVMIGKARLIFVIT